MKYGEGEKKNCIVERPAGASSTVVIFQVPNPQIMYSISLVVYPPEVDEILVDLVVAQARVVEAYEIDSQVDQGRKIEAAWVVEDKKDTQVEVAEGVTSCVEVIVGIAEADDVAMRDRYSN